MHLGAGNMPCAPLERLPRIQITTWQFHNGRTNQTLLATGLFSPIFWALRKSGFIMLMLVCTLQALSNTRSIIGWTETVCLLYARFFTLGTVEYQTRHGLNWDTLSGFSTFNYVMLNTRASVQLPYKKIFLASFDLSSTSWSKCQRYFPCLVIWT